MAPNAVTKAKQRLALATAQLREAEVSASYEAFCGAWYFFLIAAKNVYTSLEQGAKTSPQSRQWFGAKKQERKNDPLLQYLFQARDDDEHGLGDVTRLDPGHLAIGKASPGYSSSMTISLSTDDNGVPTIHRLESHDGLPVLIESVPARAILVPVTARANIVYQPPILHLGHRLPDSLPITVGNAAINYLTTLVSEAEARAA